MAGVVALRQHLDLLGFERCEKCIALRSCMATGLRNVCSRLAPTLREEGARTPNSVQRSTPDNIICKVTGLTNPAIFVTCLFSCGMLAASESNAACIEVFSPPVYPHFANYARIQGRVKLRFEIDSGGRPKNSSIEGHPLLLQTAHDSLLSSKFSLRCDGWIELVYSFVLIGEPNQVSKATAVSFKNPNEYMVTANPLTAMVNRDPGAHTRKFSLGRLFRRQ